MLKVNDSAERSVRIDKWLWAIRAYKTRAIAAEACKTGKITINGSLAKASREVKAGDIVAVKKMPVIYSFKVLEPISARQGAARVPMFAENITPQSELDKLIMNVGVFVSRDKGTGRPTKKERRDIDSLMSDFFFDADDE